MRKDKQVAIRLRLQGRSYNEIAKSLSVSKGTLSGWLGAVTLSPLARARLAKRVAEGSLKGLLKRNRLQTHRAIARAAATRREAKREIGRLTERELKLIGAALYWGEGHKRAIVRHGRVATYHPVGLANSDPKLVVIFLKFLREVCQIADQDISASIRMFSHMNEQSVRHYWQKVTGLPESSFRRVYYGVSRASKGKRPFHRLPFGTISIRVNRTPTFHSIMGWIEGIAATSPRGVA